MMRLLVDCTPLSAGGGVQVAIALLENLRLQNTVTWLAVLPEKMKYSLPSPLQEDDRLEFVSKAGIKDILKIVTLMKKSEAIFKPDIVFTVFGPTYYRARVPHLAGFALPHLIYPLFKGMPLKNRIRQALLHGWWLKQFRRVDHLVVETETVRQKLHLRHAIDLQRISVIGNSLNPILASQILQDENKTEQLILLIPSSYYPHKNLDIVPAVAQALARLDPNLDFEFHFTLEAASSEWQNIMKNAAKFGVENRLKALGSLPLDALVKAYQNASVIFLPTLLEASTAVYPESFYFKRPLITSNLDFAQELCGQAALFVPPTEPEAIAGAIKQLEQSPELREKLIANGQEQLIKTYPSSQEKFQMQLALFQKVISENSPTSKGI